MADPDNRRVIRFDQLNAVGKAVFLTGAALRGTASLIDKALEKAVDVYLEAEDAFKEARDGTVEEAKILEEHTRPARKETGA